MTNSSLTKFFPDAKKMPFDKVTKQIFSCPKLFFLGTRFFFLAQDFFLSVRKMFLLQEKNLAARKKPVPTLYPRGIFFASEKNSVSVVKGFCWCSNVLGDCAFDFEARIQERSFCVKYYLQAGHDTMLSWQVLSIRIAKVAVLNTALSALK